jgi:hypothetical protein
MKPDGTLVAFWFIVIATFFGILCLGTLEPEPAPAEVSVVSFDALMMDKDGNWIPVEIRFGERFLDIYNVSDSMTWRVIIDEVSREEGHADWTTPEIQFPGTEGPDVQEGGTH